MKKVFLFLTMLFFAFTGTMRAGVDVTVGTASTTNSYIPTYTYYDYSITQQIYTASEIGMGGTISAISFEVVSGAQTRDLNVFMKHVSRSTFSGTSDWEAFAADDAIFSGTVSFAAGWVTITLDEPFEYNGTDNLLVCVQDATGTWASSVSFRAFSSTSGAIRAYRDNTPYDVANLSGGSVINYKNYVKLTLELGPAAITANPSSINMGYRPIGAWMAPYVFELNNTGNPAIVSTVTSDNNFFNVLTETPFTVNFGEPEEVEVTTGTGTAGTQTGSLVVVYTDDRNATIVPVEATAYNPVNGDVWEKAINVTSFPYAGTAPTGIYQNYELPEVVAGANDAVYKVTLNEPKLITAGTTGADGVAYIYEDGFDGVGGPSYDNNYEYNGPEVGPGPVNMWFSYLYSGTNTFFGTSAGGGMIYGYRITADMIEEYGLAGTTLLTVETAAREGSYYDLVLLEGGDTPDLDNIVYYQAFSDYLPMYFFDLDLEETYTVTAGQNLWVMFYSDSPYAAYCGKTPFDEENGKIWYTTNLSTWYSNTAYTPAIYCHFMELPTGREVTMNLADMSIKPFNNNSEIAEANGTVNGTSKAQAYNDMKANRGNRSNNIEGMYAPAGTYYVAMASTDANFPVAISVADAPAPEPVFMWAPVDGETDVEYPYLAEWILGNYTEEMQVLFGQVYPPTTELIAWTGDLVESMFLPELQNNKTYFMQVNERNAVGTTYGPIIGFTTEIDDVEGFEALSTELYPGESAVFTWEANRSHKGYNLYMDGVKVNETLITGTTYTVGGFDYNMTTGYTFNLTAVYDEGESEFSEPVVVYMTGKGYVNGHIWEVDSITPVYNVNVMLVGLDEYGHEQVLELEGASNPSGYYSGEALAGYWVAVGYKDGYQPSESAAFAIEYTQTTEGVDFLMLEDWAPLQMIKATEEEEDVLVEWAWEPAEMIVDFESGDFTQAEFILPAQYPWAITTTNPYEGTYCMKSTCEGVASGTSSIEATVDVPYEGKMGFWVRVSSETNYDKFHFYIDGVEQGQAMSGQLAYAYKEYNITEGLHTYKWEYTKDSSVNSNDDCVYVDYITMYRQVAPVPPTPGGQTYDFEDMTMQGWTTIDGGSPTGYGWQLTSDKIGTGYGHDASTDAVMSQSYDNSYGVIYPDNYLIAPSKIAAHNGAAISFYACAQDASYAAEHFGVAVSTGSATAADFTTIQEWTMTAKGNLDNADMMKSEVRGTRAQGAWYQYTVDLSSYAGQQIWVAIRHFNCSDQFYLVVDDITLADGSAKRGEGNRTMSNFILYRRNNYGDTVVERIAQPAIDVMSYVDTQWPTLDFGEYQWGIQAYYEGNHNYPVKSRSTWFDDFEDGALSNWTTIDADGDGDTWQNATPASYGIGDAYSGTNCASSWSWNSYTMYPDNYMISPLCDGATNVTYYVATNTAYPDHYGVYASSTGTNASDFTLVFEETAGSKGGNGTRSSMTQAGTRAMSDWMAKNVDLPAGTKYVAFRHWNSDDMNYLFIDDVTITMNGGGGGGTAGTLVIDFETGDFSQYDFVNDATYPWTVVAENGSYVMKSGNAGVSSSSSTIEATVEYVADGTVSFDALCMGEGSSTAWDKCIFEIDGNEKFVYGAHVSGWNNYSFPVAAGTHVFTWKYTKDGSVNPTGDYMAVDNITFDGVAGGGGGGGDIPEGFGYSDIIWSNIIEKDMTAQVIFNVVLNNGQSPVGAIVEMEGEGSYAGVVDETGVLEFEAVRKGVYDIAVELEGYETEIMLGEVIEADMVIYDVTLNEIIAPVEGLYVSPTGWVMWEGGSVGPNPPTPPTGNTSFTEDFEGGNLNGWINIDANNDGLMWVHSSDSYAHSGYTYTGYGHNATDGFAYSQSYIDYDGAYDADNYLIKAEQYDIVAGSTLTFWADNANDSYPDYFEVVVSTTGTTPADFTAVWGGNAKNGGNSKDAIRHNDVRYNNWRQHTVDLSAYAGQTVWLGFHHEDYDEYEIWIDDVTLSAGSKGDRAPLNYIVMLDGEVQGDTEMPFFQHFVADLEEGTEHTTAVRAVYTAGNSEWAEYTWTYASCENYDGMQSYDVTADGNTVTVSFVLPEGGQPTPPQPGTGEWYYYDNGINEDAIGTGGGNFWWGVMFPAGSYTGDMVTKVAAYDYMAMTGTVTIYNDGTTAPATAVGTANVTLTGSEDFVEVEFAEPVVIDPSKNLWVVYYNGSGATYPAAVCANTGDANGRWVSLDGTTWDDLAGYGLSYTFMVRAYVATGAKGEVHEISVPMGTGSNGTFANAGVNNRSNRDMWDLELSFNATSGYQYGVASDGEYIYTSSWSASSTSMFYKYDLDGNFIEEFNISGCGQLRDMTYDGQYFYGGAAGAVLYCVDLANKTLISSTSTSCSAIRYCAYDPERDGFWVGNWSTNIQLIDRTGATLVTGPAGQSFGGAAYYKDTDNVEHVFFFAQPSSNCVVYDYNIASNSIVGQIFDFSTNTPGCTGSSGGCHIGTYNGKTCFFGDAQQSPQLIAIYELDADAPVPPTPPTGDVLGAFIFVDGELITYTPVTTSPYTFDLYEPGEYAVCVRVVYSDYAMSCYECEFVEIGEVTCDPVTNLTGQQYNNSGTEGVLLQWTGTASAIQYGIYVDGEYLGATPYESVFVYGLEDGTYEFGVSAIYENCESDIVTVIVDFDAVPEEAVVSAIYPNPTSGDLHINATAMTRVSVYNTVGQMVYDQAVSCDEMVLDMSQFEAGVYMVNIVTENGTSVKRITVVK